MDICFVVHFTAARHDEREVSLTLKHGVEAKNYDDVSRRKKD